MSKDNLRDQVLSQDENIQALEDDMLVSVAGGCVPNCGGGGGTTNVLLSCAPPGEHSSC